MTLSIISWNIQGLNSSIFGLKTADSTFQSSIKNIDIIVLLETWANKDSATGCPCNYKELIIPPLKQPKLKHGRLSGGIIVWHKNALSDHIHPIKRGNSHIWLKVTNTTSDSDQALYICAIYMPPLNSPYYDELSFGNLHSEILEFQAKGSILLCGDFNARTGRELDYICSEGDNHIFGRNIINTDFPLTRESFDTVVNKSGRQLLQMCKNLGLYIINGRTHGDSLGRSTYCSHLGNSVIDYCITDLPHTDIKAFMIMPQLPLSDHCQTKILLNIGKISFQKENQSLYTIPYKYKWKIDSHMKFEAISNSVNIENKLFNFLFSKFSIEREGVDLAAEELTKIFNEIAHMSGVIQKRRTPRKNKCSKEKWFDKECFQARHEIRELSNKKHRNPTNLDLRLKYLDALKQYKKLLKSKKSQFMTSKLEQIEEAIDSNSFWKIWHQLDNTKRKDSIAITNGNIWKHHFEELYTYKESQLNQSQKEMIGRLKELEKQKIPYQSDLDNPIQLSELNEKIKSLKTGKACGIDNISSEMLKYSTPLTKQAILKLFNLVMSSGYFPMIWNQGLITPVYKNGDKMNPNNYRGICVTSILGNIFCNIIKTRILTFLQNKNTLCKSQIGFLPEFRTTDHIYTLHTLIEQYVQKTNKGKLYACFVDFQKAFDSIWHEGMLIKILESDIRGNVYTIIKDIYKQNKCCIKINNSRTEFFKQSRGVRQGCSLSPILFNIFINELAKEIDCSTGPGLILDNTNIKCLLFADDMVLLSPSKVGLQENLNILDTYSHNWALPINADKTKIMIFQKKPRTSKEDNFKIGQKAIKVTTNYNYLGLTITASGKFNVASKNLADKAQRAYFLIKKQLQKFNPPTKFWLKIIDSIIKPIALYGSEIWGPLYGLDYKQWDKSPTEVLHLQICKSVLGVHRTSSNLASRAELGRYPLLLDINKRASKFWFHLSKSNSETYHHKAFKTKSFTHHADPLFILAKKNNINKLNLLPKSILREIDATNQMLYIEFWKEEIKNNNKLEIYRSLNRNYCLAPYLQNIKDRKKRNILTKYRISDHNLHIETGRHKQTWLPRDMRSCSFCTNEVENEEHFLLYCCKYTPIRETYFVELKKYIPNFEILPSQSKICILLGENRNCSNIAADYIMTCHKSRVTC